MKTKQVRQSTIFDGAFFVNNVVDNFFLKRCCKYKIKLYFCGVILKQFEL